MITAGILNERITVYYPEVTRGKYNEQSIEYYEGPTIWARVLFQRGSLALDSAEVWLSRSIVITVRDRLDIHDRCRIKWDNKMYRIESFNRSRSDGSITITATYIDEGGDASSGGPG